MHKRATEVSQLAQEEAPRAFYEGKWIDTNRSVRSLRNILIKKERFFVRQLARKQGALLDLGCGGGWSFFTRFATVVGIDLSFASLQNARQVYSLATQGAITRLPFADASFDVVVSLDVFGHVAPQYKDALLAEVYRVLKPGGATLHYIETLSNDPLSTFSRGSPELHERYFVAPEGHIGAESPADTFARFRRAGFSPVYEIPAYKGFIYVERFLQYFDNEYCEQSQLIRAMVALLRPVVRFSPAKLVANLGITLCFEMFDPLLPTDWAGGALVCYTRPA
jgi:ubiquinone/menaquinone biosynthesis C-methylase UbiE